MYEEYLRNQKNILWNRCIQNLEDNLFDLEDYYNFLIVPIEIEIMEITFNIEN